MTGRGEGAAGGAAPARLADALRVRILEGELVGPLREQHLAAASGLARHTVRAALRALETEGVVRIERNRGARVRTFTRAELVALGELRIALEVEAARLALARHGRLPDAVHDAGRALAAAVGGPFAEVAGAHERLHAAIVASGGSPRIEAAHRALAGELRLFLTQLRDAQVRFDTVALAAEHEALLAAIEADGPDALRIHITTSTDALTTGLKF